MKNGQLWMLIPLVVVVFVLAGCGGAATEAPPEPVEMTVDMVEFAFEPTNQTVPSGAEVTINLTNSGTIVHSYYLMEDGYVAEAPWDEEDAAHVLYSAEVEAGATGTLTFTAPEAGTYQVVCHEPGHFEAGMVGELIVE